LTLLYSLIVSLSWTVLQVVALFHPKIALFVKGRRNTALRLQEAIADGDKVIWIHAASLGEYEQGLPIMTKLRDSHPNHKLLLTFFSPSGFEVQKQTKAADITVYLPLDTPKKVRHFLDLARPQLALFIKYEIWPNYFAALKQRNIPLVLISAVFKKDQVYFKPYGGFMRRALAQVDHFFVQHETSKQLLNGLGIQNVTVAGDTRLDRVSEILGRNNMLDFMVAFKKDRPCFVAGSTWPKDEEVIVPYINQDPHGLCFVLAPHTMRPDHIAQLRASIKQPTLLYSELDKQNIGKAKVLIVDTIGLLTKIYSYADVAYVGGAFGTGLHNTLEAAVFGVPIIIGPQYKGFVEAENLVAQGGILSINGHLDFHRTLDELMADGEKRETLGALNTGYIQAHKGASSQIMAYLRTLL
jgi:3-deoxy-D-manno-octulosonic-acid transferase